MFSVILVAEEQIIAEEQIDALHKNHYHQANTHLHCTSKVDMNTSRELFT